jgi:hypothetical protein
MFKIDVTVFNKQGINVNTFDYNSTLVPLVGDMLFYNGNRFEVTERVIAVSNPNFVMIKVK